MSKFVVTCNECDKRALYGIYIRTHCEDHKTTNMVDLAEKATCLRCEKSPIFGTDGAQYCGMHCKPYMVNCNAYKICAYEDCQIKSRHYFCAVHRPHIIPIIEKFELTGELPYRYPSMKKRIIIKRKNVITRPQVQKIPEHVSAALKIALADYAKENKVNTL